MTSITKETLSIIDVLPEKDQLLLNEIAKKLLLAWDPDFTKVTPEERKRIEQAEAELANGEYFSHEDVWADLEQS